MKKYSITKRVTMMVMLILSLAALIIFLMAEHGVHAPVIGNIPMLEIHRYSLLIIVAVVILSGALAYNIIQSTLKKIELLSMQIENTSVEKLSEPIEVPYADHEITDLVNSFNQMTAKLNEAVSFQARFASNIAHEFRTPLAIMQANIDLYRKKNPSESEECDQLLSLLTSQIRRLTHLSEELLNLSNLKSEDCGEKINLHMLVQLVIEDLSFRTEEKKIQIDYQYDESLVMRGNTDLLYRAIYNILENAIKYSGENTTIRISLYYENGAHVLSIADEGKGIPKEEREKIFEPFYRGKHAGNDGGSLGLGLSLVKAIVDVHHGHISVLENTPCGTVFTMKFFLDNRS